MSATADLQAAQALQASLQTHKAPSPILADAAQLVADVQAWAGGPVGSAFYSSPSGSDSNPGTLALPFKTIAKGLTKLTPGATLYLRAGTYAENILDKIPSGTNWAAPVTVSAYQAEAAVVSPTSGPICIQIATKSYIQLIGLAIDGKNAPSGTDGVKITYNSSTSYSHHVRVQGCEIRNCTGQGLLISKGSTTAAVEYNEILNCYIHDNGAVGSNLDHNVYIETNHNLLSGCDIAGAGAYNVQFYASSAHPGSTTYCSYNTIIGNKLRNSKSRSGITLNFGTGNLIANNLVYGNDDGGIYLDNGAAGTLVLFNTVYANKGNSGTDALDVETATGTTVRDNISFGSPTNYHNGGSGTIQDHNLFGVDPKFVNASAGNFLLQVGSPAIGAGISQANVPSDFAGIARANPPTIGAYEYPL